MPKKGVKVALDREHQEKLSRLAEQADAPEDEFASFLLSSAIEQADLYGERLTEILDGIPGAFERAELGRAQAAKGETIPLEDLDSDRRRDR
jgi:hypothetical protein